jgi:hypothetical protein
MATALMPNLQSYESHVSRDTQLDISVGGIEVRQGFFPSPDDELLVRALDSDHFASFVNDLLTSNEEDEEGEPTSSAALKETLRLTPAACLFLQRRWTRPRVVPDGSGGLRLTWKKDAREVRAIITGQSRRPNYLYRQDERDYSAIPNFTAATLSNELAWLYQG